MNIDIDQTEYAQADLYSLLAHMYFAGFVMQQHISIYNATIQNNRDINRVHNYERYIATVSIKHKSVDRIKTALRF